MLTAITLPGGEQRRRNEEDKLNMKEFFKEGDLLSGEIQSINSSDNTPMMHTRNLKYGKLGQGVLVKVDANLVKRMKHHFISFDLGVKAILGHNGYVWIYYDNEEVKSISLLGQQDVSISKVVDVPLEARKYIARIRNCICILNSNDLPIYKKSIDGLVMLSKDMKE